MTSLAWASSLESAALLVLASRMVCSAYLSKLLNMFSKYNYNGRGTQQKRGTMLRLRRIYVDIIALATTRQ